MDPSRYSSYAYDPAGNRVSQMLGYPEESGGVQYDTAYGYNDLNQLVAQSLSWTDAPPDPESNGQSHSSSTTYGYDPNGNRAVAVTSSDDSGDPAQESTTTYAYDTSDRLVRARYNGVSAFAAAYDARTRRLGKSEDESTPTFRYDGGTNFQELQDGQVTAELVRAGGLGGGIGSVLYSDQSMRPGGGPVEHFAYNAVGSTVLLTNDAGATTQSNLYEAFGGTVLQSGASANTRLANTKERDGTTGLDNHGFRYYDPAVGRYLTRDPLGYADGLNAYAHVGNDPVNRVDPLGLSTAKWLGDFAYSWWHDEAAPTLREAWGGAKALGTPLETHAAVVQQTADYYTQRITAAASVSSDFKAARDGATSFQTALGDVTGVNAISEAQQGRDLSGDLSGQERLQRGLQGVGTLSTTVAGAAGPVTRGVQGMRAGPPAAGPAATGGTAAGRVAGAAPEGVAAPQAVTRAYRAVSEAEYQQIQKTGKFEVSTTASNQMEGKWFSDSVEGANLHGTAYHGAGKYRVIEADVPTDKSWVPPGNNLDQRGPSRYLQIDDLKDVKARPAGDK